MHSLAAFQNLGQQLRRVVALAGVRSRSVKHGSERLSSPRPGMAPIWLVGPPRTGTSTLARQFAAQLQRSLLFEPLGPRGAGFSNSTSVVNWFRGTPSGVELDAFQQAGCAPLAGIVQDRPGFVSKLARFLESLYADWSTDVVIKEVRALPGLEVILEAHEKIGITPLVIGVDGDPVTACYAFYRLGALAGELGYEGSDVRTFWPYRAHCYRLMGRHGDLTARSPVNRLEETLLATLIDQAEIRRLENEGVLQGCAGLWSPPRWQSGVSTEFVGLDLPTRDWRPSWRRDARFLRLLQERLRPDVSSLLDAGDLSEALEASIHLRTRQAVTWWSHAAIGGVAGAYDVSSRQGRA